MQYILVKILNPSKLVSNTKPGSETSLLLQIIVVLVTGITNPRLKQNLYLGIKLQFKKHFKENESLKEIKVTQ